MAAVWYEGIGDVLPASDPPAPTLLSGSTAIDSGTRMVNSVDFVGYPEPTFHLKAPQQVWLLSKQWFADLAADQSGSYTFDVVAENAKVRIRCVIPSPSTSSVMSALVGALLFSQLPFVRATVARWQPSVILRLQMPRTLQ